jgi:hypothetical protein
MAADLIKSSLGLTSSNVRIEIPFIKVKIGDYTFGAYAKKEAEKTAQG